MNCADCEDKDCYQGEDCTNIKEEVIKKYRTNKDDLELAKVASFIEGKYYMKLCRLEELIEFSKQMDYKHLGIVFCIGLATEAKVLQKILKKNAFKITSVCCKVCGIAKDDFDFQKIQTEGDETMCNPVGQAEILNREKVDLAIVCGICVGHDILFHKHCQRPITTLVVKDRILGHNPIAALYSPYYLNNKFEV